MKALIVDDEQINRYLLTAFMKRLNVSAQLEFAENGRDAVEKFQAALTDRCPYDLVIIDYQMPLMNGVDAIRRIRALEMNTGADTPKCTICLSSSEWHIVETATGLIDNDEKFCMLPKPINFNELERIYFASTANNFPAGSRKTINCSAYCEET